LAVGQELRGAARPVEDLLDLVGDARLVLLGDASHGTHEFYALRAEVTRRLIAERGFGAVAVEADWPVAARVNRYINRVGEDADAEAALGDFTRFPRWMWRNHVIVSLVEWLREHGGGAGFYGLDLYSLRESMNAVIDYLDESDPEAAQRARRRYACFDHHDAQAYGYATASGDKESCEDAAVAQLQELRTRAVGECARQGSPAADAHFVALQNAQLAADAERYYRAMYRGREYAWNLRDTHMADTLDALDDHLDHSGVVVWGHNSHLGDARATSLAWEHREVSVGQLARERHGEATCLVGFTTHEGTVTAARDWDAPAESREMRPSIRDSLERCLHDADIECGALDLRSGVLSEERPQRTIGVVYHPHTERSSHYMRARAAKQFDLLVHVDQTRALAPLDPAGPVTEAPQTYPFAL
jgi:erythromycin esterase-like protein